MKPASGGSRAPWRRLASGSGGTRGLPGGESWHANIEANLNAAGCVVLIWSEGSIAPEGNYVLKMTLLAAIPNGGVRWRDVLDQWQILKDKGELPPAGETAFAQAQAAAAREAGR